MANWYIQTGKNSDVVVSSRVRLVRNIKNIPFLTKCSDDEKKDIIEKL